MNLPLAIAFLVGTTMVLAHFFNRFPLLGNTVELDVRLSDYFNVIAVFAFALGGGNLLKIHMVKVTGRQKDWFYSLVTVVGFVGMLVVGLFRVGVPEGAAFDDEAGLFQELYRATFEPLSATMFALLAFFVASAAFRAFRARTLEATLLLLAAFIILIGRTPLGAYATNWLPDWLSFFKIDNLSAFLLSSFNTAGQRAIQMGIALGIISTSLKLILGVERSYLGREE